MEKSIPRKGWEQMLYNDLDQIVFTQDLAQRSASSPGPYRSFLKYDAIGRIIMIGVEQGHTGTHPAIQSVLNNWVANNWEERDNSGSEG